MNTIARQDCFRAWPAVAATFFLVTLSVAEAALPKRATGTVSAAKLKAETLVGAWAGEGSPWSPSANRRWVVERRGDGRFDLQQTIFERSGDTTKSEHAGTWAFRDGLLELKGDASLPAGRAYRVTAEAPGCLRLLEVDPASGQPDEGAIAALECPHPSRIPPPSDFECVADFSQVRLGASQELHTLRLRRAPDGMLEATLDDELSNAAVDVWDYPIRTRFRADAAGSAVANYGESALQHLNQLSKLSQRGLKIAVPFRMSDVRTVRIFELVPGSRFNEFGGTVLFEVFDAKDRRLARMLRSLLVAPCLPSAPTPP